jgi:hypothetical protein
MMALWLVGSNQFQVTVPDKPHLDLKLSESDRTSQKMRSCAPGGIPEAERKRRLTIER